MHGRVFNPAWLAVAGAVGMATMGVMSRNAGVDATVITFYRLGLGAVFVFIWLLAQRCQWQKPGWLTLLGGVFLAGFIVFYVEAMNHTTMANAILVVYLAPVCAAIAGHFIWQEHINRWQLLCILVALFGFAMVMEFRLNLAGGDALGLAYAALAMLAYAAFMLLNRHNNDTLPASQATLWQLAVGGLLMLVLAGPAAVVVSADVLPWAVATGLVPGFLAMAFTVAAMQRLPTAVFGTLAYSEPVAVVVFGWWLFAEQLNWLQMAGCGVIIVAGIFQARFTTAERVVPVQGLQS